MVTHLKNLDIAIYLRKSRKDIETEREAASRGEEYDISPNIEKNSSPLLEKTNITSWTSLKKWCQASILLRDRKCRPCSKK